MLVAKDSLAATAQHHQALPLGGAFALTTPPTLLDRECLVERTVGGYFNTAPHWLRLAAGFLCRRAGSPPGPKTAAAPSSPCHGWRPFAFSRRLCPPPSGRFYSEVPLCGSMRLTLIVTSRPRR